MKNDGRIETEIDVNTITTNRTNLSRNDDKGIDSDLITSRM